MSATAKVVYEIPEDELKELRQAVAFIKRIAPIIEENAGPWLTATQAAKRLKVSKSHLMRNLKDEIGFSMEGRLCMFHRDNLDAYWAKRFQQSQ